MRYPRCLAVLALFLISLIGTSGRSEDVIVKENITYVSSDLSTPVVISRIAPASGFTEPYNS